MEVVCCQPAIISASQRKLANFYYHIKLAADGLGAVISHKYSDGTKRPITYASCTLSIAKKNYVLVDEEALALVYCS